MTKDKLLLEMEECTNKRLNDLFVGREFTPTLFQYLQMMAKSLCKEYIMKNRALYEYLLYSKDKFVYYFEVCGFPISLVGIIEDGELIWV